MNCNEVLYPPFVAWEINTECNHKCIYCYNYKSESVCQCRYDEKRLNNISDFIINHHPISVSISGGEPLLMYETVKKQIEKFVNYGIYVCIYTNGSLITKEMAQFFSENKVRIMLSFPSVNREEFNTLVCNKYTYDSVIKGLDLLKKYDVNFQPNIVATSINYNSIKSTIEFLHEKYTVSTVFISRTTKPSNAGKEYDRIKLSREQLNSIYNTCMDMSHKYNIRMRSCGGFALCAFDTEESRNMLGKVCSFGIDGYTVTSQGDVRICSREGKTYGNIFTNSFEEIRTAMCEWKNDVIPKECKKCCYMESCRGGCRMAADTGEKPPANIDCDANPKIAVAFDGKKKTKCNISLFDTFSVSSVSVVKDVASCRISHHFKYLYVNEKTAEFLKNRKKFCVLEICLLCGIRLKAAKNLVYCLLNSEIISKVE